MKLYYIGNGFDLAHSMPTLYENFRCFFKENNPEFYSRFIEMYGLGSCDDEGCYYDDGDKLDLWKDFENMLGRIDHGFIINKLYEMQDAVDITKSEFEGIDDPDPWWYREKKLSNMNIYELYEHLQEIFTKWVNHLEKDMDYIERVEWDDKIYPGNKNSYFIVFNYTHTLQKVYGISEERIYYPHGEADNPRNLPKFGHGKEKTSENLQKIMGTRNSSNDIYQWFLRYLEETRKNVEEYSTMTGEFLKEKLSSKKNIEINVVGCSFGEVDIPYFAQAIQLFPSAEWNISYHSPEDKVRMEKFFSEYKADYENHKEKINWIPV